ncbi:MAG: gliding motility-associated C-terminal domain-containing protein [Bacteroidetes bacterium]|nr:MAG: gliding motility-associated C-terminal domain-containing protein [Bacteroidota bacterium]
MLRTIKLLFASLLLFTSVNLLATHNRAGDIAVEVVGDCTSSLTVKATITTYTKASSFSVDRDTLELCWGDGSCIMVGRINGPGSPPQGELLENDTKKNIYIGYHTYTARGQYTISMLDPNRNAGILNVNYPNSDQITFFIQTVYTMPNPNTIGCNQTPILSQPPVDVGCVGQKFTHNPNAYDPDPNDSLAYRLTDPLQDVGLIVPNYEYPNQIMPGVNNNIMIDEETGDICWDAPQQAGEYNIAMYIISYRNGVAIDTVLRDMQIRIFDQCDNAPPIVETPIDEICVIAGDLVEFDVIATAPLFETDQKVRLTALGAPFVQQYSPAEFIGENFQWEEDPVVKTFRWQTSCEHISSQYYSVVFKAVDDFFSSDSGLATLKTVRIKVVGPPPEDVLTEATGSKVEVTWEKPYSCEAAEDNYFQGFSVWRRNGSNNFTVDVCDPGLEGKGYTKVSTNLVLDMVDGRYFFEDEDVEAGRTYCYRVLAQFALTTPDGLNTYNRVESLPSIEMCVQIGRDVPLITHVDVLSTDNSNGDINVCWSKPKIPDLDTLEHPGPYVYEVLRATGQTEDIANFQPIGVSFSSETFAGANDTCFIDTGLNTIDNAYSYLIRFTANGELIGDTKAATSIFLSSFATDNANELSWTSIVPWDNYRYTIYRKNPSGVTFDSIAISDTPFYRDEGLVNGLEYCYKIQSHGTYNIPEVIDPLINHSQELCSVPIDNVAPCPPDLEVTNICEQGLNCSEVSELSNTLTWTNPIETCEETDDVTGYNIYYSPTEGQPFSQIALIDDATLLEFEHFPEIGIAGCYYITAIDTMLNESIPSDTICVDNCPFYELPNTFTPNADNQNDLFKPFPYCFIERVEFKVYNQWGELVFETEDPDLNWDGTNLRGSDVSDGVYYYNCQVYEQRVSGITIRPEIIKGYIEVIRGNR